MFERSMSYVGPKIFKALPYGVFRDSSQEELCYYQILVLFCGTAQSKALDYPEQKYCTVVKGRHKSTNTELYAAKWDNSHGQC
ncbi:hypothetical protein J6590_090935 [Homalodisca vitripennis]|nr:hypothetical protein J6590_090935 [Homalodisca vitripennis]